MTNEFWLGLFLSIPIGVGTGLAVAPIERWRESREKVKGLAKSRRMREEYAEALDYVEHPHAFTQYLLFQLIQMVSGTAVMVFGAGVALLTILSVHTYALKIENRFLNGFFLTYGFASCVFMTFSTLTLLRKAGRLGFLYVRVRYFDEYRERVLPAIEAIENRIEQE